jgi:hypothetical protein
MDVAARISEAVDRRDGRILKEAAEVLARRRPHNEFLNRVIVKMLEAIGDELIARAYSRSHHPTSESS